MEHAQAVVALSALAHGHRLAIFRLLVVRGPSGALAGDIAAAIGVRATAASFHLKELDRAGLIHACREGRNIRYALHVDNVRQLLSFLTEDCCRGQPEFLGEILRRPLQEIATCGPPGCEPVSEPNRRPDAKAARSGKSIETTKLIKRRKRRAE